MLEHHGDLNQRKMNILMNVGGVLSYSLLYLRLLELRRSVVTISINCLREILRHVALEMNSVDTNKHLENTLRVPKKRQRRILEG